MGIPFDWKIAGQGIARTGELFQAAQLADYTRQQELKTFQAQQDILDQKRKEEETRAEAATIRKEERDDQGFLVKLNQTTASQKDLMATKQAMEADYANYMNSPELKGLLTNGLQPNADPRLKVGAIGTMRILDRQSKFLPLNNTDQQILDNLPSEIRLKIYEQEMKNESFRQTIDVQKKQAEAQTAWMGVRGPYYSEQTENARQSRINNIDNRIDDLEKGKDAILLHQDYQKAKRYLPSVTDKKVRASLEEQVKMYEGMAGEYDARIKSLKDQRATLISGNAPGAPAAVGGRSTGSPTTVTPSGKAPAPTELHIPADLLAKAKAAQPDLTDEEIDLAWRLDQARKKRLAATGSK